MCTTVPLKPQVPKLSYLFPVMEFKRKEDLPFKLVGMTLEEFQAEIMSIYEDVPSDNESVHTNDYNFESDDEIEVRDTIGRGRSIFEDDVPNIDLHKTVLDDDFSDPEDLIPLSMLADQLRQNNVSSLVYSAPSWNKSNTVEESELFSKACGVPEFIKNIEAPQPSDIFRLFLNDELLELITYQTNLYAQQEYLRSGKQFTPTMKSEVETFIGLNILMGIKKLPSYKDYWSSAPDLHDPYISSKMNLNRFSWLLGNLHLNDNSSIPPRSDPNYDKLYKLRPFLDMVLENFQNNFIPTENIAVDESMVKFKGRSSLKQYMPKKPVKRGYKIWMLADQSGYAWNFQIYTGKVKDSVEKYLGSRVVKDLCKNLHNDCHRLYFDNFFSSIPLFEELRAKKIYCCGTVNVARKYLPNFSPDQQMKRGDYDVHISDSNLIAVKWKDNRSVHMVSNFHQPGDIIQIKRKEKNGNTIEISCPRVIVDYNAHMNSVDLFDQKKAVYEIDRKSKKWWHRIFWYFIDACVVNAFIVYSQLDTPPLKMKDFRREICNDFLFNAPIKKRKTPAVCVKNHKPYVPAVIRQKNAEHKPIRATRRRCAVCSTKDHQVRSPWQCETCKVPLCLNSTRNCFILFHS